VQACGAQGRAGQRDVQSLGFDALGEFRLLQRGASLGEESLQLFAGGVHLLPELGSLFGGQGAQLAQQLPDDALAPQVVRLHRLQLGKGRRLRNRAFRLVQNRLDALHGDAYGLGRTDCTSISNASGSRTAISASCLRFTSMPRSVSAWMNSW
jgi:hypothetical protein